MPGWLAARMVTGQNGYRPTIMLSLNLGIICDTVQSRCSTIMLSLNLGDTVQLRCSTIMLSLNLEQRNCTVSQKKKKENRLC